MNKADLLVVEDDPALSRLIGYNLEKQDMQSALLGMVKQHLKKCAKNALICCCWIGCCRVFLAWKCAAS